MKILITGASSGLGLSFARLLAEPSNELFLVSRNKERLLKVQEELKGRTKVNVITADLSDYEKVKGVYVALKNEEINFLINNAGIGTYGEFIGTDINRELMMLDVNVKAVHALTKLFLKDMADRNEGTILNVTSIAGFFPGPLMTSYYAGKAYITSLSLGIYEELRRSKSKVKIAVLAPGPIKTEFDKEAGISKPLKGMDPEKVASYALKKLKQNKLIIIPGSLYRFNRFMIRLIPTKLLLKISYKLQNKKRK